MAVLPSRDTAVCEALKKVRDEIDRKVDEAIRLCVQDAGNEALYWQLIDISPAYRTVNISIVLPLLGEYESWKPIQEVRNA